MNKAILVGNLVRDPECGYVSDVPYCRFTVAIRRKFVNREGSREADFIPVVAWRKLAETCAEYLSKGRKVAVEGSIQTRSYEHKDGGKRYVTEVIADEVEFLSPRPGDAYEQEPPQE